VSIRGKKLLGKERCHEMALPSNRRSAPSEAASMQSAQFAVGLVSDCENDREKAVL
jgi:hypothetical protein